MAHDVIDEDFITSIDLQSVGLRARGTIVVPGSLGTIVVPGPLWFQLSR